MQTVRTTVDELDKMANDPERAKFLAEIGNVDQIVQPPSGSTFHSQEADWSAITSLKDQIAPAGDGGDYAGANRMLGELKDKVDAFKAKHDELEQQKQAYADALAQVQPRLQAASVSEPQYAKLQPMLDELTGAKGRAESAEQAEDFAQALTLVQDLATKLDAFEAAKAEIDKQKQEYETALAALKPRLDAASVSDPQYAKLQPQKDELAKAQTDMEGAAQGGDYQQANTVLQDVSSKLDALEQAKAEIDKQKQEYETALAALKPRLDAASVSDPQYAKLQPQKDELAKAQTDMEGAAQGGDYQQANTVLQDVSSKLDALEQAKAEIDKQKQEYETALAALKPRLDAASVSDPQYAKLQPQKDELAKAQTDMESAAQGGDYQQANTVLQDVSSKLDALEQAKAEIDKQKQEYETALAALKPRLDAASVSDPQYAKLQPQKDELAKAQTDMEGAAQGGDYQQANTVLQDVSSKLDALEQAKAEIDKQKQEYETALAALKPRLDAASVSDPQYAKLQAQKDELAKAQTDMEGAAQGGDYQQANTVLQDVSSKLDALEQAKAEIDKQKQEYETALAALKPRLDAASVSDPQYAKLQPQKDELAKAQTDMEGAAQGGDYQQANTVLQDVSSKLDALEQAKAEIDKQKQEYETALAALKPRLDAASVSDPQYAKLQPQKDELAKAQTDMEAAAQGGDYDRARQLVQDLTAKLDALDEARKEIDGKKQEFDDALAALRPKLDVAEKPAPTPAIEATRAEIVKSKADIDAAAATPDYEAALKAVHGLEPNLDAYAEALKTFESKKKEYDTALAELQPRLGKALAVKDDKLKAKQEALATGQKTMESAALVGNYEEALKVSTGLATQLDAFEKEAGDSGGLDVSLGGEVTLKEITLGKAPLGKVAEAAAKVGGSVKFGPAADADTKGVKKDDVELPVLQKAQDVISKGKWEIGGGPKYNAADKQLTLAVNITFSCEWGPVKGEFAPVEISLVGVDPKKGISGPKASVINLALSYKHDSMKVAVKGVTIEFSFAGSFQVEISPDYAAIAEWVLEKAAIETAEGVIAVDGAALAAGAAAIALPAAAAVAIGFGMYQEARNMRATSEAIQTALPARKRAAQAATSYGKVLTGSSGGGDEGTQHAEAQIAQIMKQTNATREQVIEAIKKAQGGSGAIRARELQRLKDQMYAEACRVFDEGHKADFGIIERQGPDWGYRGSFRKTLRILLYADD